MRKFRRCLSLLIGNRVFTGAVLYSVVGVLSSGANIILLPLLTRWMSPEEYGALSVAIALLLVLQPIVAAGLGGGVVRHYFEYLDDTERFARYFSASFWFQFLIIAILVILVAILLCFGVISSIAGLNPSILLPIFIAVALVPPRDIGNQLLSARQEHGRASMNQLMSFAVATVISLLLVGAFGMGASGRLYGLASGALVAAVMIYFTPEISSNLRWSWDWGELRHALRFGLPFVPHAAALSGIAAIDRLVLRHYIDLKEVGIYSAAMTLAMGTSFVTIAIGKSWDPKFFQLRDRSDWGMAIRGHWVILCLMPLMATGFCVLYPLVFPLLLAPEFHKGMNLMPIMAFASFGFGLFNIDASYISYRKKTLWFPIISGSGFLVSLITSLLLVPSGGMVGAAWAVSAGYLTMNLVVLGVIWRLEDKRVAPVLLPFISIVLAATGIFAAETVPENWSWIPRLIVSGGAVLLFALIWYFGDRFMRAMLTCSGKYPNYCI